MKTLLIAAFGFSAMSTAAWADSYCREYSSTVHVDGTPQKSFGTACKQADGSWRIMPDGAHVENTRASFSYSQGYSGYGAPVYAAPPPVYAAPAPVYVAPQVYAPAPVYAAPAYAYGAPVYAAPVYAAPAYGYGAPVYGDSVALGLDVGGHGHHGGYDGGYGGYRGGNYGGGNYGNGYNGGYRHY